MRPERSLRLHFEVQVWGEIVLLPNLLKEIFVDVSEEYRISYLFKRFRVKMGMNLN